MTPCLLGCVLLLQAAVLAASHCHANSEHECLAKPQCRWFRYRHEAGHCHNCDHWFGHRAGVTGCRDWKVDNYCHNIIYSAGQRRGGNPRSSDFKEAVQRYEIVQGTGEAGNHHNHRQVCRVWCDLHPPHHCFGQARTLHEIKGVNYGGRFIPEPWMKLPGTDRLLDGVHHPSHIDGKEVKLVSLCDVGQMSDKADRMAAFLDATIQERDFQRMASLGFNLVRLPLGYWNLITLPGGSTPNSKDGWRWRNLQSIMHASGYAKWIDRIFHFASKHSLKVLLDLHAAPGGQAPNPFTGCFQGEGNYYFDTDWNKKLTVEAVGAMAKICARFDSTCYGIELLNEPESEIRRESLRDFYKVAIHEARKHISRDKPVIVMEWAGILSFWTTEHPFTYREHGLVVFATHLYHMGYFKYDQQQSRDTFKKDIAAMNAFQSSSGYDIMVGEYALNEHGWGNEDDHFDYNGLLDWYVHQFNQHGIGSIIWNYDAGKKDEMAAWGPVRENECGRQVLRWKEIFDGSVGNLQLWQQSPPEASSVRSRAADLMAPAAFAAFVLVAGVAGAKRWRNSRQSLGAPREMLVCEE